MYDALSAPRLATTTRRVSRPDTQGTAPAHHSREKRRKTDPSQMADAVAMAKANEPVPDMVKQFVVYFYRHIREKNGAL